MRARIVKLAGRWGSRTDGGLASHRLVRSVAILSSVAMLFVTLPALASAATWCVAPATGCDATHSVGDVQTALGDASADPGPDTVLLGPTTYATSGYTYAGDPTNPVTIEGAGPAMTTLETNAAGQTLFASSGGPSVTIKDLTAAIDGGPSVASLGFSLDGAADTIADVDILDGTTGGRNVGGVTEQGGALTLTGSHVELDPGTSANAVTLTGGSATLADDVIAGDSGVIAQGGTVRVDRVQLTTTTFGIESIASSGPASLYVDDSLLTVNSAAVFAGDVIVSLDDSGAGVTTVLRHDTVIDAFAGQNGGVGVLAEETASGTVSTLVDSSVIQGSGIPIQAMQVASSGSAPVSIDYSDYNAAAVQTSGSASVTPGAHNLDNVDPQFVGATDFHLQATSPLIDAGNPSLVPGESQTDLDGNPRVVAAHGGCNGASDIGAYEYQHYQPYAAATASPVAVGTGQPVTFDASSSCDSARGAQLNYTWRFDDGASASGAIVQHAFATAGTHTATVTVSDPGGSTSMKSLQVTVSAPPTPSPSPSPFVFKGVSPGSARVFAVNASGVFHWTLSCSPQTRGACTVRVSITAPRNVLVHGTSGTAHRQKGAVVIATLRFRLAAGRSQRFAIKLTKPAALVVLRRTRKLKASATIDSADAATDRAAKTVAITLKLIRA